VRRLHRDRVEITFPAECGLRPECILEVSPAGLVELVESGTIDLIELAELGFIEIAFRP
jgi:hypothetical protein